MKMLQNFVFECLMYAFAIKSYITKHNNTNLHKYLRQDFELGHWGEMAFRYSMVYIF